MKELEAKVLRNILEYLRLRRITAWRNNVGRKGGVTFGVKGLPDIIGHYKGRFLGIEVKREDGGKMTPEQMAFMYEACDDGCLMVMARGVVDVQVMLDEADRCL